ncbi:serine/threonine-protein kinase [Streptomyces jeddahensis]|uniref:non-specific serine/threonine protein kinase n=1 Tax=Streptomyces jeddahensis TaxID=1716141 RepID=A0A177HZX2_9ACTN|nr:serine/threonine-protein kinase [Streptomyces jeddahensis]OAH15874.1 serine/threonine-protein kinase PrkC [Streptomyces jeddahensis]
MSAEPGIDGVGGPRRIAGRYRLLAPLGEGGMGTVWRAHDEVLGREVAVKEVRAPAGLPASDVDRLYARLEREAWAAARIPHRNVVTVYDVATEEGRPWIVMELVRGLSLSDVLAAEGPMSPRRAAQVGAEVLAALRAAHEAGVLHRDVKPGNVLIANDGRIVLTDFGIAMVEGSSALTMTGEVVGSPEFLAPERALGRRPGPESDLWSLGVLLYAAVEGSSPFRQDTPLSTLRAVVDEELPPPRRAGPLAPVIEELLRKDPAERIAADEAERDLRMVGAGGTPRAGSTQSPALSSLPAATALHQPGPSTPPHPVPAPTGSPSYASSPANPATTTASAPAHPRRTVVVLIAGMVALAVALAALTYALVNRDDPGGGSGNGSTTAGGGTGGNDGGSGNGGNSSTNGGGTTGGSTSASPSEGYTDGGSTNGGSTTGGSTTGGHGGTTSPPAQSVKVTVAAVRGSYTGTCPPPEAEAPAFTATFTVGRVPAEVDYRWVTTTGEPSDPGWKTLSFPSGGGKTKQVNHVELTYEADGTYHNEISVEVRGPVETRSNSVAFSVTCETEAPPDGAS